jgi:hypothetical protein
MQGYADIRQKDSMQLELQAYKEKCENYKEEIRRVIEQFPRSAENVQKDRQLSEVMEENQFLQDCLAKAKKHVLRSKVGSRFHRSSKRAVLFFLKLVF